MTEDTFQLDAFDWPMPRLLEGQMTSRLSNVIESLPQILRRSHDISATNSTVNSLTILWVSRILLTEHATYVASLHAENGTPKYIIYPARFPCRRYTLRPCSRAASSDGPVLPLRVVRNTRETDLMRLSTAFVIR